MKRFSLVILLVLGLTSLANAQEATPSPSPAPKPAMSRAQSQRMMIATEKKLWEAWKNKDVKPFRANLTADSLLVSDTGVVTKAAVLKDLESMSCEINSYSLSDFNVKFLDANYAILTYKGAQDGNCGGQAIPAAVWASTLYVRRGARWMAALHQETPAR